MTQINNCIVALERFFPEWGIVSIEIADEGIKRISFGKARVNEELNCFGLCGKPVSPRFYKNIARLFFEELESYFNRKLTEFSVPYIEPKLPKFSKKVLNETKKIPYGKVVSYSELAERINSNAVRAVGNALARNPLPILIPCHRVVGKNGIGGFSGGVEIKKRLLRLERS